MHSGWCIGIESPPALALLVNKLIYYARQAWLYESLPASTPGACLLGGGGGRGGGKLRAPEPALEPRANPCKADSVPSPSEMGLHLLTRVEGEASSRRQTSRVGVLSWASFVMIWTGLKQATSCSGRLWLSCTLANVGELWQGRAFSASWIWEGYSKITKDFFFFFFFPLLSGFDVSVSKFAQCSPFRLRPFLLPVSLKAQSTPYSSGPSEPPQILLSDASLQLSKHAQQR